MAVKQQYGSGRFVGQTPLDRALQRATGREHNIYRGDRSFWKGEGNVYVAGDDRLVGKRFRLGKGDEIEWY